MDHPVPVITRIGILCGHSTPRIYNKAAGNSDYHYTYYLLTYQVNGNIKRIPLSDSIEFGQQ